jgi:hypothetical protein
MTIPGAAVAVSAKITNNARVFKKLRPFLTYRTTSRRPANRVSQVAVHRIGALNSGMQGPRSVTTMAGKSPFEDTV